MYLDQIVSTNGSSPGNYIFGFWKNKTTLLAFKNIGFYEN